jgi:hypothetical protein
VPVPARRPKTSDSLGSTKKNRDETIDKKLTVAEIVAADEIILATTKTSWTKATIDATTNALDARKFVGPRPRLAVVTGLGTDAAERSYPDVAGR